jgi:hypothetical protein
MLITSMVGSGTLAAWQQLLSSTCTLQLATWLVFTATLHYVPAVSAAAAADVSAGW